MTRTAWFDAPSGIAGNMVLGALLDAGVPHGLLDDVARRVGGADVRVTAETLRRRGLAGQLVDVTWEHHHHEHHVHLQGIHARLDASGLPPAVCDGARRVFAVLAEAEARVHGVPVDHVHFHEVGAVDALVDVVGTVAGLAHLGVERVVASALPLGSGTVTCDHGVLPLPAPAVVAMLEGVAVRQVDVQGETVTPTGLALLKGLGATFGPLPAMTVVATGRGYGHRDLGLPGPLRLVVGDAPEAALGADARTGAAWAVDTSVEIQATIDDMSPQGFEEAMARLFEAGAVDVSVCPILMKKGRPAHLLTALAPDAAVDPVTRALFVHTRTIGVRLTRVEKRALPRRMVEVITPYGAVPVKVVALDGRVLRSIPEYDVVRRVAREHGVALEVIQQAVLAAAPSAGQPLRPPQKAEQA